MFAMKIVLPLCFMFLLPSKACVGECTRDFVSLLQTSAHITDKRHIEAAKYSEDVVMAYLPYNFGHSVAAQANKALGIQWGDCGSRSDSSVCLGNLRSEVTGCTLKYTPGKYWPEDLAKSYFGNKTIFGIIRDPYERMVAQFRGSYRHTDPVLNEQCNVSEGVKRMMNEYLANVEAGNPYVDDCQHLPQAEYFDQPYGVTEAIDNRFFPQTMNAFFAAHDLDALQLETSQIAHVSGCDHVWSADLDQEARELVQKVYKRDFEFLCEKFQYCDLKDNTCVHGVPSMCPDSVFTWNTAQSMYVARGS